jgi:molecular chaperone GrpE
MEGVDNNRGAGYVKAYKEEVQVEWERTKVRIAREAQKNLEIERRKIVGSLLEVLDMLDMSLDSARQGGKVDSLLKGLEMVRAEFEKKLMAHGLEKVEAEDQVFDPKVHEALAVEDLDDSEKEKDGRITTTFKAGYLLAGELVRPAMVRVGRYKKIESP